MRGHAAVAGCAGVGGAEACCLACRYCRGHELPDRTHLLHQEPFGGIQVSGASWCWRCLLALAVASLCSSHLCCPTH